MDAKSDGGLYGLRWYFRYPIAGLIVGGGAWLFYALLDNGNDIDEWFAYLSGGLLVLWAATLAWELSLLLLGLAAVWWVTTWSTWTQVGLAAVCLFTYLGHLWDKSLNATKMQLDNLQRQINELNERLPR